MNEVRLPQYTHLPAQFLWFDTEELAVIILFYLMALVFGGYFFWANVVVGPFLYMRIKRNKPRGFLRHMIYAAGFASMKGYPLHFSNRFSE